MLLKLFPVVPWQVDMNRRASNTWLCEQEDTSHWSDTFLVFIIRTLTFVSRKLWPDAAAERVFEILEPEILVEESLFLLENPRRREIWTILRRRIFLESVNRVVIFSRLTIVQRKISYQVEREVNDMSTWCMKEIFGM